MLKIGSIGLSCLYNLLTEDYNKDGNNENFNKKIRLLVSVKKTLEKKGGVFAKIAQILSYADVGDNIFSECVPYSPKKTQKFIKKYITNNSDIIPYEIDFKVYKSGSLSQVYKGVLDEEYIKDTGCEKNIIIKVQYVGLLEEVKGDINAIEKLANIVYHFVDIGESIKKIKTVVNDELNYKNEVKNHETIYDIYKDDERVFIPKVHKKLSNEKILVTEMVEGQSLSDYTSNCSQEEKNRIAGDIIYFIFNNIYNHNLFYSDFHYGNIFINNDKKISFIDFGCLQSIENISKLLKEIHIYLRDENKDKFIATIVKLGIIDLENTNQESIDYAYEYFRIQCEPFLEDKEFEFTKEYLNKKENKNTKLLNEWKLSGDLVFFCKIPSCLYIVMHMLKAKCNFYKIIEDIIK